MTNTQMHRENALIDALIEATSEIIITQLVRVRKYSDEEGEKVWSELGDQLHAWRKEMHDYVYDVPPFNRLGLFLALCNTVVEKANDTSSNEEEG